MSQLDLGRDLGENIGDASTVETRGSPFPISHSQLKGKFSDAGLKPGKVSGF
jgi:hypothetical protein